MKKLFLILTASGILISMSACGTESVIDTEEADINGSVIYVSPADDTTLPNDAFLIRGSAEA